MLMQKQQAMVVNPGDQASSKQIDILHQVNKKTCPLCVLFAAEKVKEFKRKPSDKKKKKNPKDDTIPSAVAKIGYQWINGADIAPPLNSAFA